MPDDTHTDGHTMQSYETLLTICSALVGTGFSTRNRIKSILQTAYEMLGAQSIVAYIWEQHIEQLEIVCMPGVEKREFMRGPTDKIIFEWDKRGWPDSGPYAPKDRGTAAWINSQEDFDKYLGHLEERIREEGRQVPEIGGFRSREPATATAKVVLKKGLKQTNDNVGQIFFNFDNSVGNSAFFSQELREAITSVSLLIRELMIEEVYHDVTASHGLPVFSPLDLMRRIDAKFTMHPAGDDASFRKLETAVATMICNAANLVTANMAGTADIVLLDADTLGRTYSFASTSDDSPPEAWIIAPDSLTGRSIANRKYFLVNAIDDPESTSREVADALDRYNEFDRNVLRSVMLVPIVQAVKDHRSVRAILRLASPNRGFFLDAHAKAMREMEVFVLQCLLRLDERRLRDRVTSALEFYTASRSLPGDENLTSLLQRIASAFGADWGTYWPIRSSEEHTSNENRLSVHNGTHFTSNEISVDISPDDPNYGIRTGVVGMSRALYQLATRFPSQNLFLCLHRFQKDDDQKYLMRFYSPDEFGKGWKNKRELEDGFWLAEVPSTECLPGFDDPLSTHGTSAKSTHSRVCFVIRDEDEIKGIVWLVFPSVHRIDWWERKYITGLSPILGRLERNYSLQLIHRSFRHLIPGLCDTGRGQISVLDECSDSDGIATTASNLQRVLFCFRSKADEVAVLQKSEEGKQSICITAVPDSVNAAISVVSQFVRNVRAYRVYYSPTRERISAVRTSSVFLSVLWNLLQNARRHGLDEQELPDDEEPRIVIWVRLETAHIHTVVANNGKPIEGDPFSSSCSEEREPRPRGRRRGVGLDVSKVLLQEIGGTIERLTDDDIQEMVTEAESVGEPPAGLAEDLGGCCTFFCFRTPLEEDLEG